MGLKKEDQVLISRCSGEGRQRAEQVEIQSSLYAEYYQFGRINAAGSSRRRRPRSDSSSDDHHEEGPSTITLTNQATSVSPYVLSSPLTASLLQDPLFPPLPYYPGATTTTIMDATACPLVMLFRRQQQHGDSPSNSSSNVVAEDISHQRKKKRRARQLIDHALSIMEEASPLVGGGTTAGRNPSITNNNGKE